MAPVLSYSRTWPRVITKYPGAFCLAHIFLCYVDSETCLCFSHEAADEIATRALEYDPRAVKIRYRRVTARKNMCFFDSAIKGAFCSQTQPHHPTNYETDLEAILEQDPTNAEARRDLTQISQITYAGYPMEKDDDEWPRYTVDPYDFAEDSDTEDCKHKPQRPPCRFYNRGTCDRGASCRFSHAPDALSVRDEL